jgi:uncharacterized protein YdaU (DUF1376 family)
MTKNIDKWMPLYIGDYLADTGHLTTTQHGAYLLLIMHYWRKGGLPGDDKQLAAIAKLPLRIWLDSKDTLQAFFHDGWKHKRVDSQLERQAEISSKRVAAGAKGGRPRKQEKTNCEANGVANQKQSETKESKAKEVSNSEADASGAQAPDDPRTRLFREGLAKLSDLTGKGPDACRSFVGKCLQAAGDDAVTVLGLIYEAERNRVAQPSSWISARLKGPQNGPTGQVSAASHDLVERVKRGFGGAPPEDRSGGRAGETDARLLSYGRG